MFNVNVLISYELLLFCVGWQVWLESASFGESEVKMNQRVQPPVLQD